MFEEINNQFTTIVCGDMTYAIVKIISAHISLLLYNIDFYCQKVSEASFSVISIVRHYNSELTQVIFRQPKIMLIFDRSNQWDSGW